MGFYFLWQCASTFSTMCTASFSEKTKCCTHAHAHTKFRFCKWQFFMFSKLTFELKNSSSWIQYTKQRAFCKLTVAMLGCAYEEYFKTDDRHKWLIINYLLVLYHILYLHSDLLLETRNDLHTTTLFYGKHLNWLMKKFLMSNNMKRQQSLIIKPTVL